MDLSKVACYRRDISNVHQCHLRAVKRLWMVYWLCHFRFRYKCSHLKILITKLGRPIRRIFCPLSWYRSMRLSVQTYRSVNENNQKITHTQRKILSLFGLSVLCAVLLKYFDRLLLNISYMNFPNLKCNLCTSCIHNTRPELSSVTLSFFCLDYNVECENELVDKVLDLGEVEKIIQHATPLGLMKCKTNTLTKSFEVSQLCTLRVRNALRIQILDNSPCRYCNT